MLLDEESKKMKLFNTFVPITEKWPSFLTSFGENVQSMMNVVLCHKKNNLHRADDEV